MRQRSFKKTKEIQCMKHFGITTIILFFLSTSLASAQNEASPKNQGEAFFNLGNSHLKNKEYNLAIHYFEQASEAGIAKAKLMLGNIYAYGWGGLVEYKISSSWYRAFLSAAAAGDTAVAQVHFNLGYMYIHGGNGLLKDAQEGLKWLTLGASEGNIDARELLEKTGIGEK
jgi:TPR repeat protein